MVTAIGACLLGIASRVAILTSGTYCPHLIHTLPPMISDNDRNRPNPTGIDRRDHRDPLPLCRLRRTEMYLRLDHGTDAHATLGVVSRFSCSCKPLCPQMNSRIGESVRGKLNI